MVFIIFDGVSVCAFIYFLYKTYFTKWNTFMKCANYFLETFHYAHSKCRATQHIFESRCNLWVAICICWLWTRSRTWAWHIYT